MAKRIKGNRKMPGSFTQKRIIEEQTGRCGYCNGSLVDVVIQWDHFVPFAYTNTNDEDNWVASCRECNQAKGSRLLASEADLTDFCLAMLKSHGSIGDGWPDGSTTAFRHILA